MSWIDWGDAPTAVGVIFAGLAAFFSWRQKVSAEKAAHDAQDALAVAIRPYFLLGSTVTRSWRPVPAIGTLTVELSNGGPFPASDVKVHVAADGREIGTAQIVRVEGHPPGVLFG